MDKIFEKLGIYDFLGIWTPGALTVTYYLFTIREFFFALFDMLGIKQGELSGQFLFVILYTAVAYIVGVILHETGKIIVDKIPCFKILDINKRINKVDKSNSTLRLIRCEVKEDLTQNIRAKDMVSFYKAISYLKYKENINTKRIDTYHAIYALSRSLSLCFTIHFFLLLIWFAIYLFINKTGNYAILSMLGVDFILIVLFYVRTYRYFYSWVKNIYLQYYLTLSNKKACQ